MKTKLAIIAAAVFIASSFGVIGYKNANEAPPLPSSTQLANEAPPLPISGIQTADAVPPIVYGTGVQTADLMPPYGPADLMPPYGPADSAPIVG